MFINGMDISMISELEEAGAKYYFRGKETDIFSIFNQTGVNLVRLRLWKDPYDEIGDAYGGGTNDLKTTLLLAKRAAENGLELMLDIHYSDFWADPSKQHKPKVWRGLTGEKLIDAVYHYTLSVLHALAENGTPIQFVQIGNEITNGLIWPDGHIDRTSTMAALLASGMRAVREFDRQIKIIVHLDFGSDNKMYRNWFGRIEEYRLDYDIIGMSYYPYWNDSLNKLLFNMNDISSLFQKDIIVVETAFGYTVDNLGCKGMIFAEELAKKVPYPATKAGQKQFMQELIATIGKVNDGRGLGFVYWEPAWLPFPECTWAKDAGYKYLENDNGEVGNSWANQALFDEKGYANPVFEIFGTT
jgi:arabinogalactan endo-1,4-beta-galactosidase